MMFWWMFAVTLLAVLLGACVILLVLAPTAPAAFAFLWKRRFAALVRLADGALQEPAEEPMPSAPPLPRRWDESDDVSTTVGSSAASAMADASCEPSRLAAIARAAVSSDVESLGHAFMSLDVQVTEFIAGISRLEQRLDLVSEQADFLGGDVCALLQERSTGTARGLDVQALLTHRLSGLQSSVRAIARFGVNSRRLVIGRHLLDAAFAALLSWCDRCRGWRDDLRVSALERVFVQWVRFVEDRRCP